MRVWGFGAGMLFFSYPESTDEAFCRSFPGVLVQLWRCFCFLQDPAGSGYGWLSKLWSLFGPLLSYGTYYLGYPKRDLDFDNCPLGGGGVGVRAAGFVHVRWVERFPGSPIPPSEGTQRAQYPLIKEYTLNHNMKPYII